MNKFVDRKAYYINRKCLSVIEVTRDANTGELKTIIADVTRSNRESVYVNGTPINAEAFNAIFDQMNDCLGALVEACFISGKLQLLENWVQVEGTLNEKTFIITLSGKRRLYAKATITHNYLTATVKNRENEIEITIKETVALNNTGGSTTRIIDFVVEFYGDANYSNYFSKHVGVVNYTNTSTNPID